MGNKVQTISYECGSKYVGQVLNQIPHGKGVLHIHKNSPSFNPKLSLNSGDCSVVQISFENGKVQNCKINLKNSLVYEGKLCDNISFDCEGKLTDSENVIYEGAFENGRLVKGKIQSSKTSKENQIAYVCQTQGQFIGTSIINGPSTFHNITDQYLISGDFHKGKLSRGFFIFPNGDRYQGEFSQGLPYGPGVYKTGQYTQLSASAQGQTVSTNSFAQQFMKSLSVQNKQSPAFELAGTFQNGNPNGKGELKFSNGDMYKGRFKDGQMHGQGEYTFSDGTLYKGSFYCGSMNGDCTMEFNEKSKINQNKKKHELLQKYEGQSSNGVFHGLGILYYANGVIFKGYFLDGAKNGPGVLIFCQNKYKCLYIMNKLVGQLKLITDQ